MLPANAAITGSYDYLQVVFSVLIAISASYAALDLGGRVTAASGWARSTWLTAGATAMGIGIWSMHFTGMLAFRLPAPVSYNWPIVLVSLLVAILASAFALYVVSRHRLGMVRALTGSVIMGGGIAGMHYIGMAAMRLAAVFRFHPLLVVLSVVFAIVFSFAALLLAFDLREETKGTPSRKAAAATMMGAAVSAMHYTGMASVSFMPSAVAPNLSHAVSVSVLESVGIALVTFIVLGVAIVSSSVDRRLSAQALQLDLAEAKIELAHVTRIATIGELTASIAHEINQPLTAAVTDGSAALRWLAMQPPNLDEAREAMTRAIADAKRASEMIGKIRALFKETSPQLEPLNVNEIIREVLALTRNELLRSGVTVRTELAADVPTVLGDRVQLQQLMRNLIINGIEAVSMITDRSRELLIKSAKHPDGVLIQVQDWGRGLDPKQADRIFEPFFTTKREGIGMGLAISRSIVEAHGGRLWATPGSPRGAILQFTLPKAENAHD